MRQPPFSARRVLASAAMMFAATTALPASSQTLPCIDTSSQTGIVRRSMLVLVAGKPDITVVGSIAAFNQATGEIGLAVSGLDAVQVIKPSQIKFLVETPSMVAQMPMPLATPLGMIGNEFPASDISIVDKTLRYPGCSAAVSAGHEIAFTGFVQFGAGTVRFDGGFFDYALPSGGSGPGIVSGKPG
jgi:hypothetical protein